MLTVILVGCQSPPPPPALPRCEKLLSTILLGRNSAWQQKLWSSKSSPSRKFGAKFPVFWSLSDLNFDLHSGSCSLRNPRWMFFFPKKPWSEKLWTGKNTVRLELGTWSHQIHRSLLLLLLQYARVNQDDMFIKFLYQGNLELDQSTESKSQTSQHRNKANTLRSLRSLRSPSLLWGSQKREGPRRDLQRSCERCRISTGRPCIPNP